MSYETLELHRDGRGVLYVTLNRAEKRNALSEQMMADLTAMAGAEACDPATRAVVLRGAGKVFCAGGDLDWMRAQIAAGREARMAAARVLAEMLGALNTIPRVVIACVQGGAFGGGVGLACVSDIVLAEESAKFGLTETRLGLIPATIGPYVAARMGEGRARRVFLSARIFGAAEACELGVASRVVAPGGLEAALEEELAPCLETAPGAVAAAKAHLRALGPAIGEAEVAESIQRLADTWDAPEAEAGIAAFFERRPPPWSAGG